MSEPPLANTTPLGVAGALFKDLTFAFKPRDIPNGAVILQTLKRNGAIIVDELKDASIVLIDTELPTAPELLREAAGKVVLHCSWVNKSLNAGHSLQESSNWGDCIVTPDNINTAFPCVPPPPPSSPQLQTPPQTPEDYSFDLSPPSGFSQGSTGVAPPSSRPPYALMPSHWPPELMVLQNQTPQLPPANQVPPYNPWRIQPPSVFSSFFVSQPTDRNMIPPSQPPPWTPFHSGTCGVVQQPTAEDVRRAYEVMMMTMMMMWSQRQFPLPPPTQAGPSFYPPALLAPQNPPSVIAARPDASRAQATPVTPDMSHQSSTDFNNIPQNLGGPQSGPFPGIFNIPTPPPVQLNPTPSPPLHTHPKIFEHSVGEPIKFFVPITLRKRGKIAEIFRVTGGRFVDDVEDADYVILGQGEEQHFDEIWYSAQDCNRPTVKPEFVIDSREKGRLLDPNDYPTTGPRKPRKNEQMKARSRPTAGSRGKKVRKRGGTSPQSAPSGETPQWLRSYTEAEKMRSFQHIGAMFKKNVGLTRDALAIHLCSEMSDHTVNSWKKYCLHYRETIEDLRKRAINDTKKRAIPRDQEMAGMTATAPPLTISQHVAQRAIPQQVTPQATVNQDPTTQTDIYQQPASPCENQSPPQRIAKPILVKMEPLDDRSQSDFDFAVGVLSGWNPNKECDAELWERMKTTRSCLTAPSWGEFCIRHWHRFECYFSQT